MSVLLETSLGDIVVDVLLSSAPAPSLNFIKLCKIKYFNDCEFFRIESGFVARTGDPNNDGTGGMSIYSQCEPAGPMLLAGGSHIALTHARKGTVSFAASNTRTADGSFTYASQFFITLADGLEYLDEDGHTVFGVVAEGMSVVDRLGRTPVDSAHRPFRVIRVRHTIVLDDPFADPPGMPLLVQSPEPTQTVPHDRLASDDDDEDNDVGADSNTHPSAKVNGKSAEHIARLEAEQADREARSRAEVLEMVGDIGDANLKPPDNVLFVCKLHPVTDAEGLQIIFSRFGECHAEVIKDRETGESLCYAFIEFETKQQCENAYFKMDNALIDDRSVRVDFSQSVSKLWNDARRNKRGGFSNIPHKPVQSNLQPHISTASRNYEPKRRSELNSSAVDMGVGVGMGADTQVTGAVGFDRVKRRKTRFDKR